MKGFTINTLNLVSETEKRLKIPIPPYTIAQNLRKLGYFF